eukprot:scaffold34460_cov222-Skeletonema_dohrnii-CCMP3373.AAC.1
MEKHPKMIQHYSHAMQRSILLAPTTTLRSVIYNIIILQLLLKQALPSKEQAHTMFYELLC